MFIAHGYNRLWDIRSHLQTQNNNLTANNAELVLMVTKLRFKHEDFDVHRNEDGTIIISTGVADLIEPRP